MEKITHVAIYQNRRRVTESPDKKRHACEGNVSYASNKAALVMLTDHWQCTRQL